MLPTLGSKKAGPLRDRSGPALCPVLAGKGIKNGPSDHSEEPICLPA